MKSQFEEILSKRIASKDDKTIADALVEKIIRMALDGDRQMIKLIWEHMDGKPPKWKGDPEPENMRPEKRELTDEEKRKIDDMFAPKPWPEDERK